MHPSTLSGFAAALLLLLAILVGPVSRSVAADSPRELSFSGIEWIVRDTGGRRAGPGDNLWYDGERSVWIEEDALHLKLQRVGRHVRSVEVYTREPVPAYGRFSFRTETPWWEFEPYVVFGFFLYQYRGPEETPQEYELDIEFSRWGVAESPPGHFTVQFRPAGSRGNTIPSHSFDVVEPYAETYHEIEWEPGLVTFRSIGYDWSGHPHEIASATFAGEEVPPLEDQRLHLNFWFFGNPTPPADWEREIVLREVKIWPAR